MHIDLISYFISRVMHVDVVYFIDQRLTVNLGTLPENLFNYVSCLRLAYELPDMRVSFSETINYYIPLSKPKP